MDIYLQVQEIAKQIDEFEQVVDENQIVDIPIAPVDPGANLN